MGSPRSSDISEVVELVDNEQKRAIFDVMDKSTSAEVLEKVDEATRAELFELLRNEELRDLVFELDPDDAADILYQIAELFRRLGRWHYGSCFDKCDGRCHSCRSH